MNTKLMRFVVTILENVKDIARDQDPVTIAETVLNLET